MKTLSAYDLLLADTLQGMNQFDLVHIDNIDRVNDVLEQLGFDITQGIHIYAAQHRTLKNEVKVGYVFSGDMSLARKHLTGPFGSLEDRMIAASIQDKSLFAELHSMSHVCPSYGNPGALDQQIPEREDAEYKAEEQSITEQIKQLEDILFHIRGSQYRKDGSVKTAEDYKNPEVIVVKKKRKKKEKKVEGV
jgi:hypothetical protein